MTEEAQAFYDDVREKSITARSAHSKSRRSAMTPKSEGHAPEKGMNLNKPINYKEFKGFSKETQKLYLEGIVKKYNVGPYVIAQTMGVSGTTLVKLCKEFNIKVPKYTSRKKSAKFLKEFAAIEQPPRPKKMKIQNTSMSREGAYDADCIVTYIKAIFPAGAKARVSISVEAI